MKLAIIGTGRIVHDALYAMKEVESIELTAILARPHSIEKGRKLAGEYSIPAVYTDYHELLEKDGSDAVYIGLVNNVHYEYAKEALLKGKSVILEKPLTGFLSQTLELAQIATEKGLFLLEAITVLHNGVFGEMRRNLGKLGSIRLAALNFSQYSSKYDAYLDGKVDSCFDRSSYGGSLYDINVYNIHYAVGLFGRPDTVNYYPNIGFNGIDTSGVLILDYGTFKAVCTAAKDSDSPCYVSIQGEKGFMRVDGKPNNPTELRTVYVDESTSERVRDDSGAMVRSTLEERYADRGHLHRMSQEFADFSRIVDSADIVEGRRLLEESITVMEVLERARESARIVF